MDRLSSLNNGCQVYEREEYLESVSVKEEPTSEDDGQRNIPLECMLCAKKLSTLSGLKAHVIAQHNYKTVKRKSGDCTSPDSSAAKQQKHVCNVCARSFVTSTDLKVHETCHDKFCCFVCHAKFNSFKQVSRHRRYCKSKDAGAAVTKPKTLADILRERKAQKNAENLAKQHAAKVANAILAKEKLDEDKQLLVRCFRCSDTCFYDKAGYKIHKVLKHGETDAFGETDKKIEIEIANVVSISQNLDDGGVKNSLNVITKESDKAVKDTKEQVDYAKIENELESIFDVAVEKRQLQVTILENETDCSPNYEDDGQHKTVEEILSQESKTDDSDRRQKENINEHEQDCNGQNKQSLNYSSTPLETNTQNFIKTKSSLSNKVKSDNSCQHMDVDEFNLKSDSNNELDKVDLLNIIDTIQSTEAIKELLNINVDECNDNQKSEQKVSAEVKPIETSSHQLNKKVGEQDINETTSRDTVEDHTQKEINIDNSKTIEEIKEQNKENETNIAKTIDDIPNQENVTNFKEAKVEGQAKDSKTIEYQTQNEMNIENNVIDEEIKELNKENKTNIPITIDYIQNQENPTSYKESKVQDNQDEKNATRMIEMTLCQEVIKDISKAETTCRVTSMETCSQPEENDKQNKEQYTILNNDFEGVDQSNETGSTITNKVEIKDKDNEKTAQDEKNASRMIEMTLYQEVIKDISKDETTCEVTSMETCYLPEENDKQNREKCTILNNDIEGVDQSNETGSTETNKAEIKDKENEKTDIHDDSEARSENTANNQDEVDRINTVTVEQDALVKTLNDFEQNGAHVEENVEKVEESKPSNLLQTLL